MLAGSRAALRYLLPACAFVIFFGCATVQELITTPVPPDADPDATALVILACEVTEFLEDLDVVGALLGLDEEVSFKEAVMRDDHGFEYRAYAKDNVFAFERLSPGRHVLIEVTAEYYISTEMGREVYGCGEQGVKCPRRIEFEYPIPTRDHDQLSFDVASGDVIFGGNLSWWEKQDPPYEIRNSELGTTIIDYRRDDGGPFVTHGKLDEIDALEVFLKKNKDSPWVGKVRTRLETLREAE